MADDFLGDYNKDVKSAIAARKQDASEGQVTLTKVLEKRLSGIFSFEQLDGSVTPNKKKIDTFVSQLTIMREGSSKLAACSPASMLNCMIACGHLDIMPNTAEALAYIIPYGTTAQFQMGYKGLMELAFRTNTIVAINAELVFDEDEFEVSLGTKRTMVHKPNYAIDRTLYENVKTVYATAALKDGNTLFHVMTMFEVNKIRESSQAAKSKDSPWQKWPEGMAKKTVIKQMLKYMPSSTTDNRFKDAIVYDDRAEAGKLRFNEDNSINLDAETDSVDFAVPKKSERVIKTYAQAEPPEAEIVPQEDATVEVVLDAEAEPEAEQENYANEMTDEELRDAIDQMIKGLKLSELQTTKIHELAGSSDIAFAERAGLIKAFTKLDDMYAKLVEKKPSK